MSLSTRGVLRYYSIAPTFLWPNHPVRHLVAAAAPGLCRTEYFYRLLHLGRLSGNALFLRELHLAFLFAGNFWGLPAQLVRTEAGVVARLAVIFARAPNPVGPGWVQAHLLLL